MNRVMLTSDRVLKPVRKGWFEVQTLGLAGVGWARERRTDLIWGCCASWTPLCCGGAGRRCVPVGRSAGMGQRGQVGGSAGPLGVWLRPHNYTVPHQSCTFKRAGGFSEKRVR